MKTEEMLSILEKTPVLLQDLLASVPQSIVKQKRIEGKWTVHEHACHICIVDHLILKRLRQFLEEDKPIIAPYIPGKNAPAQELMDMDLKEKIEEFQKLRSELIQLFKSLEVVTWHKEADHPMYQQFTPYIMLRHIMMHDHLHLYRIEELWLTKDSFLKK